MYGEGGFTDKETLAKLKSFRKFNTMNTDKNFHFKYWILEDPKLADKLKIDTANPGDVYVLRPA